MSAPAHLAPRTPRPRRWRYAIVGLGVAVLAIASVPAFAADNIFPDGDIAKGGPNVAFSVASANCDKSVAGELTVSYNGNSTDGHFAAGESLHVDFSTIPAGVHIVLGTVPSVPATWGSDEKASFPIPFSTSIDPGSPGGKVEVTVTGNTSGNGAGDGAGGKPNFQVNTTGCTTTSGSNTHAPVVGVDAQDTNGLEGSAQSNAGSFTDADGNDTIAISGSGAGTVTDNGDGTWSWAYTPLDEGSGLVTVSATDGVHTAVSDTFTWTATNVNPIVAKPAFLSTSVDCTSSVTLSNISFSDPGVNDDPWSVDVDWGDGSTHTTYNTNDQGAQSNLSHTYNAVGTWTATVTVTDEDTGQGSNTSSNTITVNQVYATDFLPPFDDSTPSGLIVNQMKNGRTVPVKATIKDVCTNSYVTSPAVVNVGVKKVTAPTTNPAADAVETYADAGASSSNTSLFRWTADATAPGGGFWIYNLDSKGLALVTNSFYRVDIYVGGVQATKTNWGILQPVK